LAESSGLTDIGIGIAIHLITVCIFRINRKLYLEK